MTDDSWSDRAGDWLAHWSRFADPARAAMLAAVGAGPGTRALDVGCGTGELAALLAALGAQVSGLDAAERMLAHARERLPGADLRLGSMETLPWDDASFDLVVSINAFQFAGDPADPVREAARVVRPGGLVAVSNWGPTAAQEVERVSDAWRGLMPPRPRESSAGLWGPGVLSDHMTAAGLAVEHAADVAVPFVLADREAARAAFRVDAGWDGAYDHASPAQVDAAIDTAIAPFRRDDGSYRFENSFRLVVARR